MKSDYSGYALTSTGVTSTVTLKKQQGVAAIEFALVFPVFLYSCTESLLIASFLLHNNR